MGSVPTGLGPYRALWPCRPLKDQAGGSKAWGFRASINAPGLSWSITALPLSVPRAVVLKPSSDLGAPEAYQYLLPHKIESKKSQSLVVKSFSSPAPI